MSTTILYHGSRQAGLKLLEPRRASTPLVEPDAPAAVYAGGDAAYCAAHAFPGGSNDGVGIGFTTRLVNGKVINDPITLTVPAHMAAALEEPISVYELDAAAFEPQPHIAPKGLNFRSVRAVEVFREHRFPTIRTAVESLGGKVVVSEGAQRLAEE